jgi:hypothetical protein
MNTGDLVGGKYRITQRLGAGATGTVWAAINERTGRRVALELVAHPTDELRYRLLREAHSCGGLEHRSLVEIDDVGETESGDPFLVMQLHSSEPDAGELARVFAAFAAATAGREGPRPAEAAADERATAKTVPEMRPPAPARATPPPALAPRVPVRRADPRLYAAIAAGSILTGALVVLLASRASAPVAVDPPREAPISVAPGEAPASPAEPPGISPAATGPSPVDRAPAAVAATVSPPSKPPSLRPNRPVIASGAPLQPCTRLVRRNCRLVQP